MSQSGDIAAGEFAAATAVRQLEDRVWEGHFTANWLIGQTLSGGYAMSVGVRVLSEALAHPDPITVTGHFLARTEVGPVRCEVDILRSGGASSCGTVKLIQHGELKILVTGIYGNIDKQRGETQVLGAPPLMPAIEDCEDVPFRRNQPFREHMLQRIAPANVRALRGDPDGRGVWHGWLDFVDGSAKDLCSLVMFSDALPPPVFGIYGAEGWVPTLELTVQMHRRPAPGPLRCVFGTDYITEGIVNEDCKLWDSDGNIVAIARQTAKYRLPK